MISPGDWASAASGNLTGQLVALNLGSTVTAASVIWEARAADTVMRAHSGGRRIAVGKDDFDNRVAVVEPGVTNLAVTNAVEHAGFFYAPDPSSQIACTIGGNVAENSGGVHSLKYGVTTNNVVGLEMVLMTGEVIRLGGKRQGHQVWCQSQ